MLSRETHLDVSQGLGSSATGHADSIVDVVVAWRRWQVSTTSSDNGDVRGVLQTVIQRTEWLPPPRVLHVPPVVLSRTHVVPAGRGRRLRTHATRPLMYVPLSAAAVVCPPKYRSENYPNMENASSTWLNSSFRQTKK